MSQKKGNVTEFSQKQVAPAVASSTAGDGDGGGSDRLAAIEARLASLETRVEYMATKEDIQKLKVWVLGSVLGGMATAATITVASMKLFSGTS